MEIFWMFLIYGFLGWCSEVAFAAAKQGKFVNRGFLNGPICPIYGVGATVVILALRPLSGHIGLLFVGSVIVTSVLELATGYILETVFHDKWWDYSKRKWNIRGYICLEFSLLWGAGCVMIVRWVQPLLMKGIRFLLHWPGHIVLVLLLAAFLADCLITLISTWKLSRKLRAVDEIQKILLRASNNIGGNLSSRVLTLQEAGEKQRDTFSSRRQELEETLEKYRKILEKPSRIHRRLLDAFPHMASEKRDLIMQLRDHFKKPGC